jgi:hypothetical protein
MVLHWHEAPAPTRCGIVDWSGCLGAVLPSSQPVRVHMHTPRFLRSYRPLETVSQLSTLLGRVLGLAA